MHCPAQEMTAPQLLVLEAESADPVLLHGHSLSLHPATTGPRASAVEAVGCEFDEARSKSLRVLVPERNPKNESGVMKQVTITPHGEGGPSAAAAFCRGGKERADGPT